MPSDHKAVTSYATYGLRLWAQFNTRHGHTCPCLICADVRAYLKQAPLVPAIPGRQPEQADRRTA